MSNRAKKPQIRFKGFEDEWKEQRLEDIYHKIRNAFVGTATPYYVNSGKFYLESNNIKNGQINRNTEVFINREFYEKQRVNWLHTGDLVMVQSGHVGHSAVIPEKLNNTAAHALIIIANPIKKNNPYFFNFQFQTQNTKKNIDYITTGNTIKHILSSEIKKFNVYITNDDEQEKITKYLKNLEGLVNAQEKKCEKLKNIKKAMLEKMFPQNGSKTPQLRFKGFDEEWEPHELNNVCEFYRGKDLSWNDIDENGKYKCVLYGNLYTNYGMIINEIRYSTNSHIVNKQISKFGDVLIPCSDTTPTGLARASSIELDGVILGGDINILRPKKDLNGSFLSLNINTNRNKLIRLIKGTTVRHLDNSDLKNVTLYISKDVNEQIQIGEFFKNLDNLITAQEKKCEKLKNIKKAMLEKMFV